MPSPQPDLEGNAGIYASTDRVSHALTNLFERIAEGKYNTFPIAALPKLTAAITELRYIAAEPAFTAPTSGIIDALSDAANKARNSEDLKELELKIRIVELIGQDAQETVDCTRYRVRFLDRSVAEIPAELCPASIRAGCNQIQLVGRNNGAAGTNWVGALPGCDAFSEAEANLHSAHPGWASDV